MSEQAEPYWVEVMVYGAVLSGRCSTVEDGVRVAMVLGGLEPDEEMAARIVKRVKERNESILKREIEAMPGRGK